STLESQRSYFRSSSIVFSVTSLSLLLANPSTVPPVIPTATRTTPTTFASIRTRSNLSIRSSAFLSAARISSTSFSVVMLPPLGRRLPDRTPAHELGPVLVRFRSRKTQRSEPRLSATLARGRRGCARAGRFVVLFLSSHGSC